MALEKYCFLATIDEPDNRGDVLGMIRGTGSILDLIEGRDPEPSDPTIFNRWVLKPSLLPAGTPEIPVMGGMGINTTVPAVVRNELSDNRLTFWWTLESGVGGWGSRERMQQVLRDSAATNNACSHYWQIVPGDSLSVAAAGQPGDLLSKFTPFQWYLDRQSAA